MNDGTLNLDRSAGQNAIPAGTLTIGDGTGALNSAKVVVKQLNNIVDSANITINRDGQLFFEDFITDTAASLSLNGAGNVTGDGSGNCR